MGITFAYLNYLDDASPITASSENISFPAINVINPFRSKVWRTEDGDIIDQSIVFDLGFQVDNPNTLIITNEQKGIQLSESAEITLEACNDGNWTTPQVSVSVDWSDKMITKFSPTGWGNYRFWRLLISDPDSTDNYLEISNIFLGKSFTPTSTDLNIGWEFQVIDDSQSVASDGNEIWFDQLSQRDKYSIELNMLSKDDRDELKYMFDIIGQHKPFFIMLDPLGSITDDIQDLSIYGRITNELIFSNIFYNFYKTILVIEESL